MKITWNKNPLDTVIELDDHEKELLKKTIKLKEYEDMIFFAWFHLDESNKCFSIQDARKELDPEYWCNDEEGKQDHSKLDTRVDVLHGHYLAELKRDHSGDCTCFPCSCAKCNVESMIGINTIKGLDKYSANKINAAFGKKNERTIDEAIYELENYDPVPTPDSGWDKREDFEQYIPKWKAEAQRAADWLKKYRDDHFSSEDRDE